MVEKEISTPLNKLQEEAQKIVSTVMDNYRKYGATLSDQSKQDAISRAIDQSKKSGDLKSEVKKEIFRELASTSPFVALKIEMDFYRVSLKKSGKLLNLSQMEQMYSITSKYGIIPENKEQGWAEYQQGSKELKSFVDKLIESKKPTATIIEGEKVSRLKVPERDLSYLKTGTDQQIIMFAQQELAAAASYLATKSPDFNSLSKDLPLIKIVPSGEVRGQAVYQNIAYGEDKRGTIIVDLGEIRQNPNLLKGTLVHELTHAELDRAVRARGLASSSSIPTALNEGRATLEESRVSGDMVYPVAGTVYAIIEKIPGAKDALSKGDITKMRDSVDAVFGAGFFNKAFDRRELFSNTPSLELTKNETIQISLLSMELKDKNYERADIRAARPIMVFLNELQSNPEKYAKLSMTISSDPFAVRFFNKSSPILKSSGIMD
ncbi:MAG: hypothetical protein AABX38_05980 [Candidatus Micrarchaeota archaeon]